MDKEDARKQTQTLEQLHERRKQVVRLPRRGHRVMQIVDMSGLSYPTVRTKTKLRDAANEHMSMLENSPERGYGYGYGPIFEIRLLSMCTAHKIASNPTTSCEQS